MNVALHRVEAHQVKVVLGMRFFWGPRIALPVALGLTNMAARRFLWLNLTSAAVWSVAFSCVGYGAGRLISRIAVGLVSIAVAALIWHLGRPKRTRASALPAGR